MKEYRSIKQVSKALVRETKRLMKREIEDKEWFYLNIENCELMFHQAERNLDIYCKMVKNKVAREVYGELKCK